MTTPTKGVDADIDHILSSLHWMDAESVEAGSANGDALLTEYDKSFKDARRRIKALIRQELEAVRAEIPEKQLSTLEDRPVTHGWNMAITEMTEKLDKRMEAL